MMFKTLVRSDLLPSSFSSGDPRIRKGNTGTSGLSKILHSSTLPAISFYKHNKIVAIRLKHQGSWRV